MMEKYSEKLQKNYLVNTFYYLYLINIIISGASACEARQRSTMG